MAKMTKRFVDSLDPRDKEYVEWDGDLSGFGIRVRPTGRKSFIVWYRNETGRARKLTLGTYGQLTVAEARKMALGKLAEVAAGDDPAETKVKARGGVTVADLAERYMEQHARPKKKPLSIEGDQRFIDKVIAPKLGKRSVQDITRQDIAKLHHSLRKTPVKANRLIALMSKMFNLAEAWGLRPDGSNPCRHIQKFKEKAHTRYLSTEELSRLGAALKDAEVRGKELPVAIAAIRLLMFTGMRKAEALNLKWSQVQFDRAVIELDDSKTGEKPVYLNESALAVLADLPRVKGNPYVFPGRSQGGHLVGLHRPWNRIRTNAGLMDVRLHDLRHSFASIAAASGMGLPLIGALLGHSQPQTTNRYAHFADDPQRAAAQKIGQEIQDALNREPENGKVVELPVRAKSKG